MPSTAQNLLFRSKKEQPPYGDCSFHLKMRSLHAADKRAVFLVHDERAAGMDVALQDRAGDERLGLGLQVALHRARAVDGVEAVVNDVLLRGVRQLEAQFAVGQAPAQAGDEVVDDVAEVPLDGTEAGSWSLRIVEQSQGKGCC